MSRCDFDWSAIAARYATGETLEQLALDIGCSAPTVREHIRDLVPMRPPGRRAGVAPGNVANRASTQAPHLTPTARIVRPSVARWYR